MAPFSTESAMAFPGLRQFGSGSSDAKISSWASKHRRSLAREDGNDMSCVRFLDHGCIFQFLLRLSFYDPRSFAASLLEHFGFPLKPEHFLASFRVERRGYAGPWIARKLGCPGLNGKPASPSILRRTTMYTCTHFANAPVKLPLNSLRQRLCDLLLSLSVHYNG